MREIERIRRGNEIEKGGARAARADRGWDSGSCGAGQGATPSVSAAPLGIGEAVGWINRVNVDED